MDSDSNFKPNVKVDSPAESGLSPTTCSASDSGEGSTGSGGAFNPIKFLNRLLIWLESVGLNMFLKLRYNQGCSRIDSEAFHSLDLSPTLAKQIEKNPHLFRSPLLEQVQKGLAKPLYGHSRQSLPQSVQKFLASGHQSRHS